ncbi:hypothetical protein ONZ45_g8530 [Pleurotus djamor]|nr:hypothetical protein ONZ45_g8530 [Pleurotus djamor]
MAQGSPGNPPPPALQRALADAAALGGTARYGDDFGDPPLRRLLAEEMKVVYEDGDGDNGEEVDVVMEDVALTAGGNMAFVAAVMTLADAGDEVIIPSPWYFNHQMTLDLLGIRTVVLPCKPEDGFIPSVEVCESLITERTRAIALVSPNNPTGAIYPPSLLASFAQLARSKQIALILDETYRDFILDDPPHSLFNFNNNTTSNPPWRTYLIHLFSFSKSYAIPGLRLGAIIANPLFLNKVKTVLDCLQICPSRVPQVALHTDDLLPRLRRDVREMAKGIGERHRCFREGVPEGWVVGSQGGYFAYVRHPFGVDSRVVCRRLAEEMGVVALPDYMFNPMGVGKEKGEEEEGLGEKGEKGAWIRFSVANLDEEGIRQVCARLAESVRVLG